MNPKLEFCLFFVIVLTEAFSGSGQIKNKRPRLKLVAPAFSASLENQPSPKINHQILVHHKQNKNFKI